MYVHDDDELLGETAEPAPAGWSEDPREMKKRARMLYEAGDHQGASEILEALYEQGLRYPVPGNIAVCRARMGDLEGAAGWMALAIDDPAFAHPEPYKPDDLGSRGAWLECYYQWSQGVAHLA